MIGDFYRCASGVRFGRKPEDMEEIKQAEENAVTIRQYTLRGDLVREFDTIEQAAASVGGTIKNIENVLDGTFKSSKGFIWQYSDDDQIDTIVQVREDKKLPPPELYSQNRRQKPVEQYSLDGELMRIWDTTADAAIVLGITKRGIRSAALGRTQTYHGFMWRYLNESDVQAACGWKITDEEVSKILELHDKGYTNVVIADVVGVSEPTVRKYINMEERLAKRIQQCADADY